MTKNINISIKTLERSFKETTAMSNNFILKKPDLSVVSVYIDVNGRHLPGVAVDKTSKWPNFAPFLLFFPQF